MWASGYYGYLSDYLWWWIALASLGVHTYCAIRLWPRNRRPRLRLVVGNLLVTMTLLTAVGTGIETWLRFCSFATDSMNATLTSKRWFPAYSNENSLYFRDEEWTKSKPAGEYRIAFLGDSYTYGWGVNDPADRFTEVLQRQFDAARLSQINVMNMAWRGWSTGDQLKALQNLAEEYQINETVLCYLLNDFERVIPVPDDFDPFNPPKPTYLNVESSYLVNYIYYRVFAFRTGVAHEYLEWLESGVDDQQVWQTHESQLTEIVSFCRDRGMAIRVVLMPFPESPKAKRLATKVHTKLSEFFGRMDVPLLDLMPVVQGYEPEDLMVNAQDRHPNERAHALFAQAIWDAFYAGTVQAP